MFYTKNKVNGKNNIRANLRNSISEKNLKIEPVTNSNIKQVLNLMANGLEKVSPMYVGLR